VTVENPNGLFQSTLVFYIISSAFLVVCFLAHCLQREKIETLRLRHLEDNKTQALGDQEVVINSERDDNFVEARDEARQKSFGQLYAEVKDNLQKTDGLLYALIYVLFITLAVYPGLAFKSTFSFMSGV